MIVVGDVGLLRAAVDIADGEDPGGAGAQPIVDDDCAGIVGVDPGLGEPWVIIGISVMP